MKNKKNLYLLIAIVPLLVYFLSFTNFFKSSDSGTVTYYSIYTKLIENLPQIIIFVFIVYMFVLGFDIAILMYKSKKYFKFIGIINIIGIGLFLLTFVLALLI